MKLFAKQEKALSMARQSMRDGLRRPIIAAGTSFGKTVLSGQMMKNCQDSGKKGWFLCDRIQLVQQTIDKFTQMGVDFGVRQADHPLANQRAPIQIVSIQTLMTLLQDGGKLPEFDMAIVDECHTQYEVIKLVMEKYNNIPIIGLTATPYSKGLGKLYNNLLVPTTQAEQLEGGFICPVRYYGGAHVDMAKVKSLDPNNYSPQSLEAATDDDTDILVGDIIRNWLEWGENSQTIAFSPTQKLSKSLVERFNAHGIPAEHIDCYFKQEDRLDLYEAHGRGEFKILSCAKLLNTGYDEPRVRCLIDCFPVKSVTTYVQRDGRLRRIYPGKEYAIYLDHASNFERFGDAVDIVPECLHDGDKTHNEREQTNLDKKEIKTAPCPQCRQEMVYPACKACGYEIPQNERLEDDGSRLVELTGKKANRVDSKETKEQFLSELIHHGKTKDYKEGWAKNQYREKYGVWPNQIKPHDTDKMSQITQNWLKYQKVKYFKGKQSA